MHSKDFNDSIVLINTNDQELGFLYETKFMDQKRFHLKAHDTFRIFADKRLVITQTNQNQNFYLLYPGDTLYAYVSKKGDAIFKVMNDSSRNNELELQWRINEATPLNFMKIAVFRSKYFDSDYLKMDSIYIADYESKIKFIEMYKVNHPLSNEYEKLLRNYYKSILFANKLWLGTATKAKLSDDYTNYLNSLQDSIIVLYSHLKNPLYPLLPFSYARYRLKHLADKENYYDSLYVHCRDIDYPDENVKQIVLFKIVKQFLEKNSVEKRFIRNFISNIGN